MLKSVQCKNSNSNSRQRRAKDAARLGSAAAVSILAATSIAHAARAPAFTPPKWNETALVDFDGANGAIPWAGLISDTQGNMYSTTFYGGSNNDGTVFRIDTSG